MKLSRCLSVVATLVSVIALTGCGADKEAAKKGHSEIEALCKEGKKKEALDKALALRDSNAAFKAAFDGATSTVEDKTKANICGGLVLTETGSRIDL